ncbi:hypothetical protein ANCDUO_22427 [Ancylostoma duodenale]|uniref:Uncharacterized protein n=1 Tax=Ancylostoma duodenale TaxID=51022 RepID=A0A0C2FRH9_9BILA|nr:hypothetical protein ANCDUO_22427 [Ancylostoma duodenale]
MVIVVHRIDSRLHGVPRPHAVIPRTVLREKYSLLVMVVVDRAVLREGRPSAARLPQPHRMAEQLSAEGATTDRLRPAQLDSS